MISHDSKCIFIHQRKNAGSSIIEFFGVPKDTPEHHLYNEGVLSKSEKYGYLEDLVKFRDDGYLVFAVCRNPWDRAVSGWKYLIKEGYLEPTCSLYDALNGKGLVCPNIKRLSNRKYIVYTHLLRPQVDTLMMEDGKCIANEVLRFETIDEDFFQLARKAGYQLDKIKLPKKNKSTNDSWKNEYDEKTDLLVRMLFSEDIHFFNYKDDGPNWEK